MSPELESSMALKVASRNKNPVLFLPQFIMGMTQKSQPVWAVINSAYPKGFPEGTHWENKLNYSRHLPVVSSLRKGVVL